MKLTCKNCKGCVHTLFSIHSVFPAIMLYSTPDILQVSSRLKTDPLLPTANSFHCFFRISRHVTDMQNAHSVVYNTQNSSEAAESPQLQTKLTGNIAHVSISC